MLLEVFNVEGKNEEEVLEGLDLNDIHYKIEESPAKLLKRKKYELTYINKNDVKSAIKDFMKTIEKSLKTKINLEIRNHKDSYNVMLISEDNAILIGKEGRTLNSLQLLIHQMITNKTGFNIRINVDASNYKSNKQSRLEREIKKIATDVLKTKMDVKLDPMNSYERRIVHSIVGEFKNLETESIGEAPDRYTIIKYKED